MLTPDFRGEIRPLLPAGAFLRRDRGDGLYVTNAPAFGAGRAVALALESLGYCVSLDESRLGMVPAPWRLLALEANHSLPPDAFAASLKRFAGLPVSKEAPALFAQGIKALEAGGSGAAAWEKRLRQAAALAMRQGGGGGLYACALVRWDLAERKVGR